MRFKQVGFGRCVWVANRVPWRWVLQRSISSFHSSRSRRNNDFLFQDTTGKAVKRQAFDIGGYFAEHTSYQRTCICKGTCILRVH